MSSIVPYAAGELAGPLLYGPTPAHVAFEGYKDAKWAARKIGKWAKKRIKSRKQSRPRKRRRNDDIGRPPSLTLTKRQEVRNTTDEDINSRTLYSYELTTLSEGGTEDNRHRSVVNCKGFSLCFHVYNMDPQPKFLNIAVLCPKHRTGGIETTDFFRGNTGTRGEDFSTTRTALELAYNPINTDNYHVIRHYRYQLGSPSDSAQYNSDTGPVNWLSKKMWIPFRRQLTYGGTASSTCDTPIFFCYWYDRMRAGAFQTAEVGDMKISFQHTMFFNDVM